MKARQARKIAKRMQNFPHDPGKGVRRPPGWWWAAYRHSTLVEAEATVRRVWLRHCTRHPSGNPKSVSFDYFRMNRLHSFVVRQPLVKANWRRGWRPELTS